MKKLVREPLLLAATIAVLALPSVASAEYLVPPSNSAATQYTETVPTAGGGRDAEKGRKGNRSPAAVLGSGTARRLEEHGEEGREVAEFSAETAPEEATDETPASAPGANPSPGGVGDSKQRQRRESVERGGGESDEERGVGAAGSNPPPSGSSGPLEVLAQATGASSSGGVGILLPFALLATAAWALAFLWRQRNRPTL